MSNTAKLQLGFSPLTKKIHLAKMKDVAPGVRVRVGNDRGRDVTDEAAQLVWQLVIAEGGEVAWQLKDGIRMVLKAEEVDKEPAPARYEFDEPALNIAQKIMECRATAAAEGWPDVQLKAAIQCLVIEAMKWAAPGSGWTEDINANSAIVMLDRINTLDSDDDCRIEEIKNIIRRMTGTPLILPIGELRQRLRDQTGEEWFSASDVAVPEGWKLVPIEPTAEMMLNNSRTTPALTRSRQWLMISAREAPRQGE